MQPDVRAPDGTPGGYLIDTLNTIGMARRGSS
jgi:hypothetical protein